MAERGEGTPARPYPPHAQRERASSKTPSGGSVTVQVYLPTYIYMGSTWQPLGPPWGTIERLALRSSPSSPSGLLFFLFFSISYGPGDGLPPRGQKLEDKQSTVAFVSETNSGLRDTASDSK